MATPTRMQIEESFGYRLRERRMERDLTHEQLAELVRTAASEQSEEYAALDTGKAELEQQILHLNEHLSYLTEAKTVDSQTIASWERGRDVPTPVETEILADTLYSDAESKARFIGLANTARSQSLQERLADIRRDRQNSFAGVLAAHLDGFVDVAVEEINKAHESELLSARTHIEQEAQEAKEAIADIQQKMNEQREYHLIDGDKVKHRVVLSNEEKKAENDITLRDAIYFMETGLLPSQNLYNLVVKGIDHARPLNDEKADMDYRYNAEMSALNQPVELPQSVAAGTDPDRPRTSQEFVDNCQELEAYARLHAELFHALGYVAQQRAKNSPVDGVVVTSLHEEVSQKIGRSGAALTEFTPFYFDDEHQGKFNQCYLSDTLINSLADKALPDGADKEAFRNLCSRYNEAKREIAAIMHVESDAAQHDKLIPEAARLAQSGKRLQAMFMQSGLSPYRIIKEYAEPPILSDWSYSKMLRGSLPSHRSFSTYFRRLKARIDADPSVTKDRNFDDRYNAATSEFMRDFYDYENANNRFAARFSRIVGDLNKQWERPTFVEEATGETLHIVPPPPLPRILLRSLKGSRLLLSQ